MQAFNVVKNEKYKANYNIHWRRHIYRVCIFPIYVLQAISKLIMNVNSNEHEHGWM
jgi:hypothetical protein